MFKEKIIILSLAFALLMPSAHAQDKGQMSSSAFEIRYSDEGITSLKRVNDLHDTNYIAAGSALGGLIIRYRTLCENEWQEVSEIMPYVEQAGNTISYTIGNLLPTLAEKSTASSASGSGNLQALNDGRIPFAGRRRRGPQAPAFTMRGSNGEPQWVQYSFPVRCNC